MLTLLGVKLWNFVKTNWKLLLAVCFGGFIVLKAQGCYHRVIKPSAPTQVVLPKNDKEIINVTPNKVTVITPKGTTTVTGSRDTKVEIQKDGTVKVTEKTLGWEHQIGGNAYGGKDGLGAGLDLRFAYYKNFDALTGIGYLPTAHKLDLWLGCSYTIHNTWMSNTAVFVGYSAMSKAPVAGVSLRF